MFLSMANARILASTGLPDHIANMATTASESVKRRPSQGDAKILGRSAATGKFVLKPASKSGRLSMREAKTAVKDTLEKKH